jgi:hypothetical protein
MSAATKQDAQKNQGSTGHLSRRKTRLAAIEDSIIMSTQESRAMRSIHVGQSSHNKRDLDVVHNIER